VSAQDTIGHWMWSQKYTAQEYQTSYCNEIVNMETDSEGNIYYFGTFGSNASYGNAGSGGYVTDELDSNIINFSKLNLWIAKYTREGEKVWQKVVSMARFSCSLRPGWMELHNDTLYITGNYYFEKHLAGGRWMWFYDTLITDNNISYSPDSTHRPPFVAGSWTFLTKMDLDGNIINTFFVQTQNRHEYSGGSHLHESLSQESRTPIHVDRDGNIYFLSVFSYDGDEDVPYIVSVYNGESIWNYDFYLPGSYGSYSRQCHAVYKFKPDGQLIWQKRFFEQTENVQTVADYWIALGYGDWDLAEDTMAHYRISHTGFAADEDDNLYFSGAIEIFFGNATYDNQTQYPVRIFVDSTHWVEIASQMEARSGVPFLFKIDTSGTVRYLRQPRKNSNLNVNNYLVAIDFYGISVSDSSVYVIGNIYSYSTEDVLEIADGVFFDRAGYPDQSEFPLFVRYDKETGAFRNYGTSHVAGLVTSGIHAGEYWDMHLHAFSYEQKFVSGNRLFALLGHISAPSLATYYMGQWCTDGTFIDTMLLHRDTGVRTHLFQPQPDGDLLAAFLVSGEFSLGDAFYTNSASCAIFGVYHNDVFTYPYVGIDELPQTANFQSDVSLFPNPGKDFVTVSLSGSNEDIRTVEVFDLNGRRVLSTTLTTVNVSALPAGTYLFRITTGHGIRHTKFVKQR